MKKVKMTVALLLAALLMLLCTGCGAGSLLIGSWTDASQSVTMAFSKDGTAVVTAYGFPLDVTYSYEGDTLTLYYSETITETGMVTFFGDDEFCWEKEESDGEMFQDYYTRTN